MTDSPTPPPPPEEPAPDPAPPPPPALDPDPERPPTPAAEERPVLRRSRDDRVIAGVAGGLARYFGIDPVLLRIAFVVLVFAGGSGILLYLIGWLVIPEERPGDAVAPAAPREDWGRGPELIGLALIALGVFFLLRLIAPSIFDGRYVWPVILILVGAIVLLRGARR